ncbi:hypothetical protein F01_260235 [Burkholderia cenocepacia]|nr:hypothetical protein F01_260235 [Burkholderia cenocepacia]
MAADRLGPARPDPAVRAGPAVDAAGREGLDQQRARVVHEHQRVGHPHLQRAGRRAAYAHRAVHRLFVFADVLPGSARPERRGADHEPRARAAMGVDPPQRRRSAVSALGQPDSCGGRLRGQGRAGRRDLHPRLRARAAIPADRQARPVRVPRGARRRVYERQLDRRAGVAAVPRRRLELGARLRLPEHRQQRRRLRSADQVPDDGYGRIPALVQPRLGRRDVLRHRHRDRCVGRARVLPGRGHRCALAQPGRPDQRRRRVRPAQPQRAPVPDARHRFLNLPPY